jgi:hypothetical protein
VVRLDVIRRANAVAVGSGFNKVAIGQRERRVGTFFRYAHAAGSRSNIPNASPAHKKSHCCSSGFLIFSNPVDVD